MPIGGVSFSADTNEVVSIGSAPNVEYLPRPSISEKQSQNGYRKKHFSNAPMGHE